MIILLYYFIFHIYFSMIPEQTTPILTTWGLNIDQMLQNLSTKPSADVVVSNNITESTFIPENSSVLWQQSVLWNTFSIDAITKPVSPELSSTTVLEKQHSFRFPTWARTTASVVSTFLLLVVGGFVFKTTYPVETKDFTDKIFGVVDSVMITTENNTNPGEIVINDILETGALEGVHSVAPDNYITDTPLADAISDSQAQLGEESFTEQVLDTVVWTTGTQGLISSWTIDIQMPSVENTIDTKKIQENLLMLSQSAQEAITNLIWNDWSKLSIMRVIYRKSQALLTQVSDSSFVPNGDFVEQVQQLQALYDKTIAQ